MIDWNKLYTRIKAHLWVPFLLPLLLLIITEYIYKIAWMIQIGIGAFIIIQGAGILVGFWARLMSDFANKTYWDDLEHYRICTAIPTIRLGMKCFDWAMTDEREIGGNDDSEGSGDPSTDARGEMEEERYESESDRGSVRGVYEDDPSS